MKVENFFANCLKVKLKTKEDQIDIEVEKKFQITNKIAVKLMSRKLV